MSDINALLWRKVQAGKRYDPLIPKSNCTPKDVGIGMTDLSVKEMAELVKISLVDTAGIAPLFSKNSLKETCAAIYGFIYNHFQYKADTAVQYLRSPSCSWNVRYDGIDCKSYSIIASSILCNLGLTHYIRQIRQPGFAPEMWTHVYIVVPVDQKNGSFSKGHFTIDGTVSNMNEPLYTQKSDLKMSLQHIALRGVMSAQTGLGISLGDIKGMFSGGWSPSCIGGTYDATTFNKTLATVAPWFDDQLYMINDGIRNNTSVFEMINKLLKNTQQFKDHSLLTSKHNWNSKCSKDSTKAYGDLGEWYNNIIMKAFLQWLQTYFDVTFTKQAGVKRGEFEIPVTFKKQDFNENSIEVVLLQSIKLKSTTKDIKRFEITPYVQDKTNQSSFDILKFISGLGTTLASFNAPAPTNTTTNPVKAPISTGNLIKYPVSGDLANYTPSKNSSGLTNKVDDTGLSTAGIVLIGAGCVIAIKAMTSGSASSKKKTTAKAK